MDARLSHKGRTFRVTEASPEHAAFIRGVAEAADVRHVASLRRGFLLFPWKEHEYRSLAVQRLGLCLCIIDDDPAGYICSFPAIPLPTVVNETLGNLGRQLVRSLTDTAIRNSDRSCQVVYQMALRCDLQGKGLGGPFFDLFTRIVQGPYYGVVLEKPLDSIRRVFWRGLGFTRLGSVELSTPPDLEFLHVRGDKPRTLQWGIYRAEARIGNNATRGDSA